LLIVCHGCLVKYGKLIYGCVSPIYIDIVDKRKAKTDEGITGDLSMKNLSICVFVNISARLTTSQCNFSCISWGTERHDLWS
jgi:hypothetical protein